MACKCSAKIAEMEARIGQSPKDFDKIRNDIASLIQRVDSLQLRQGPPGPPGPQGPPGPGGKSHTTTEFVPRRSNGS